MNAMQYNCATQNIVTGFIKMLVHSTCWLCSPVWGHRLKLSGEHSHHSPQRSLPDCIYYLIWSEPHT